MPATAPAVAPAVVTPRKAKGLGGRQAVGVTARDGARVTSEKWLKNGHEVDIRISSPAVGKTETFTLWVSYATYLPLQSQRTGKDWTEQEQYQYLPYTSANQARLSLTVPRGFTQTPVTRSAS